MDKSTDIMTAEDVSTYLQLSKRTVYQLVKQDSLPATRVGDSLRFYRSEIDIYLKRRAKKMRYFLVIDDAPAVCSLVCQALEEYGYTVLSANSGAEALTLLEDVRFDHIFLDLKMPGMEGDEVLRRIRLIDNKVPVTIITGYADSDMMTRARAFGVHKVLTKPFNISEIVAVING
jgi:two-component system response regulator (stage 0 sporulation protein F)